MTQPTTTQTASVNKFHKIAALVTIINRAAKVSDHVETADLTIAESLPPASMTGQENPVATLFHPDMISDSEARDLDRQLVRITQQLMAEKIEDAVAQLADLGVDLAGSLTEKYTVAPEDQL